MNLQDLGNLILIRNHLKNTMDGLGGGITKENSKKVQQKISYLDEIIIKESLTIDLTKSEHQTITFTNTNFDMEEWRNLIKIKVPVFPPSVKAPIDSDVEEDHPSMSDPKDIIDTTKSLDAEKSSEEVVPVIQTVDVASIVTTESSNKIDKAVKKGIISRMK